LLNFLSKFKYFDSPLQWCVLLLSLAGLTILYSTTLSSDSASVFYRQLVFFVIGLVGFIFLSFFDYHTLAKANRIIYVLFVVLLVYLLVFGSLIRGGRRWINFGFFNFQPAEFVKLVIILALARFFYLRRGQINSWRTLIVSFLLAVIPAGLILLEPDLGSASVILVLWVGALLISPIKKKHLAILFFIFLAVAGVSWKFFLKDFQRDRVLVFLNPQLDPKGKGYNVRQAAIAVGSGQWFGRGLGKGLQSQNKFLPERQTDFIFAASGEEVGFVGTAALLGLYFFLFIRLLKITRMAKDDLGMYISGGVFFLLFFHVLVNVGMNIGLLPVTGIPLPFVSAGGSSLIVVMWSLGVVQNVAMQSKVLRF
jgi:rod shape determining protein RodA